jgi:hypothetical protein
MLLALVVSTTVATAGMANPVSAAGSVKGDDKGPQVLVLDDLKSELTLEEIQKKAAEALRQPLPEPSQVTAVAADKDQLTADQIEALLAGKEAPGAKRLGQLDKPSPTNTLNDLGRASGGLIVVIWRCYIIIWQGWVFYYCIPRVIVWT